jgi:hypothetical protein
MIIVIVAFAEGLILADLPTLPDTSLSGMGVSAIGTPASEIPDKRRPAIVNRRVTKTASLFVRSI